MELEGNAALFSLLIVLDIKCSFYAFYETSPHSLLIKNTREGLHAPTSRARMRGRLH